jgi:hypothetical protein
MNHPDREPTPPPEPQTAVCGRYGVTGVVRLLMVGG